MEIAELIRADCLVRITSQSNSYSQMDLQLSHAFVSAVLLDQGLHVKSKNFLKAPFFRFKMFLQSSSPCNPACVAKIFLDHKLQEPILNIALSCVLTQLGKYQHAFGHVAS